MDSRVPPDSMPYRYVRVDDLSNTTTGPNPGADIDAIILEKADGRDFYAERVEAFQVGGNETVEWDPTYALGAPDSVLNYTDTFPSCDAEHGFISLSGGYLIVWMPENIEVADSIAVIEVGGCAYGGGVAEVERVRVQVSVYAEPSNLHWVVLGQGEGPYLSLSVTSLPAVSP